MAYCAIVEANAADIASEIAEHHVLSASRPTLFVWSADRNMKPCPLDGTYQLARNVLAACVRPDEISLDEIERIHI